MRIGRGLAWGLLALLLTGFIFYNSYLPMQDSGRLSAMVTAAAAWLLDCLGLHYLGDLEYLIRKLAHFSEFGLLGFLICKSLDCFCSRATASGYVLLLALLVAVIDEGIQLSSPGRSSSVLDVLLDFSGSGSFFLAYRLWQRWRS